MTICSPEEKQPGLAPHIAASSALLRLAQPFFLSMLGSWRSDQLFREDLRTWSALRMVCELILARRALELTREELCHLAEALRCCPFNADRSFMENLEITERIRI